MQCIVGVNFRSKGDNWLGAGCREAGHGFNEEGHTTLTLDEGTIKGLYIKYGPLSAEEAFQLPSKGLYAQFVSTL